MLKIISGETLLIIFLPHGPYVSGDFANCCFTFLESSFAMFSLLPYLILVIKYKIHCFSPVVQVPFEKDLYFNKLKESSRP